MPGLFCLLCGRPCATTGTAPARFTSKQSSARGDDKTRVLFKFSPGKQWGSDLLSVLVPAGAEGPGRMLCRMLLPPGQAWGRWGWAPAAWSGVWAECVCLRHRLFKNLCVVIVPFEVLLLPLRLALRSLQCHKSSLGVELNSKAVLGGLWKGRETQACTSSLQSLEQPLGNACSRAVLGQNKPAQGQGANRLDVLLTAFSRPVSK